VTLFIDKLVRCFYSAEYAERKNQHNDEIRELIADENEISVFVCTLALPFAPCPLHIYEPRYRLMLRRAIETGKKQFGMAMYSERTPYRFSEYGCMLEIQTYQFTRDGRSIVTTIGGRRFRVLKSGTKDGYNVAKVEWVKDIKVEDEAEKLGK
jgi:Lon protease-like protein